MTRISRQDLVGTSLSVARSAVALAALIGVAGCPAGPATDTDMNPNPGDMASNVPDMTNVIKPPIAGCSKDDWCWMYPQPQGNALWSVWGSSATDAWAVGERGTILHYTGGQWQQIISPTRNNLYAIFGTSANNIIAAGDRTVLKYNGQSWAPVALPTDLTPAEQTRFGGLFAVWGSSANDIWIVGAGGMVFRYNGTTLSRAVTTANPNDFKYQLALKAVWGSGGTVYAAGGALPIGGGMATAHILKFDGTNFSLVSTQINDSETFTSIYGTSATDFFVASTSGYVRRYNGTNFMPVTGLSDYGIYGLWGSGTEIYAVGNVNYPNKTDSTVRQPTFKKWNGTTFADVPNAPQVSLYSVWGSDPNNLIAVGASGTIVTYSGGTFKSSSSADALTGVGGAVNGIANQNGTLTAVGEWGSTLRYSGNTWTSVPSSPYIQFRGVAGTAQDLLAIGYDSSMMASPSRVYSFSGGSFTPTPLSVNLEMRTIWLNGTDGVIAGNGETVLRRNGTNWNKINPPGMVANPVVLRSAHGATTGKVFVVGGAENIDAMGSLYPGKVFTCTATACTQETINPAPLTLHGVWAASDTRAFAVGEAGTIYTYDGSSWTKMVSNTYTALYAVCGTSATEVYAAGANGTLLRYDGQSWTRQDSGTNNSLVGLLCSGQDVYVTGASGTVLRKLRR